MLPSPSEDQEITPPKPATSERASLPGFPIVNHTQITSATAVLPRTGQEHVRIAFLIQTATVWNSWKTVYEACLAHPDVTPHVVLTPFHHIYGGLDFYDTCRELLIKEDVPYFPARTYDLASARPHVVFVQNPYHDTRPSWLSPESLRSVGARVAYIPYGLEIGGGGTNLQYQYNLETHQLAWRIFARSTRHRGMFGRYCETGSGHVVVTGHPRVDLVTKLSERIIPDEWRTKIGARRVILWTPHFSFGDEPQWSTFGLYGEAIISELSKRDDLFLLLRPHPHFFAAARRFGTFDEAGEKKFRARINDAPNMLLDETADYLPAFAAAGALIADAGSFLLEFLPTGKPILYLHHPQGYGLSEEGDVVRNYYVAEELRDVVQFIEMIASNVDAKRDARIASIPEFLFGADGCCGERICNHVVDAVTRGDDYSPSRFGTDPSAEKAVDFWRSAQSTYLAPAEYYERQRAELQHLLDEITPLNRALDIGCGDGHCTLIIAKRSRTVVAVDISPSLIEQAEAKAVTEGLKNISFQTADLRGVWPAGQFDLVSCMGVTSSLTDDADVSALFDRIASLVRPGGWLILKDTLSSESQKTANGADGYVARYRSAADYVRAVSRREFVLVKEVELGRSEDKSLMNSYYLFRRRANNKQVN